jgi:hypothetical protein
MVPDKGLRSTPHGKTANAIYNLLLDRQDHDEPISHAQISKSLGIGITTTQRHLKTLIHHGLVMQTKGKSASSYKVSTLHSVTRSVSPIGTDEVVDTSETGSSFFCSSSTSPTTPPSIGLNDRVNSIGIVDRLNPGPWCSPTSVPPVDAGDRLGWASPELYHLVAYFEFFVLPRAERKITDVHRRGWLKSARRMVVLKRHSVTEVAELISWIFLEHDGQLPGTIKCKPKHRKITRLDQLSWYYTQLLEEKNMKRGLPVPEPENVAEDEAQGQELSTQIAVLVDLWKQRIERENRGREVSEEAMASWAETFRVSLVGRKIPFTDLEHVLQALADYNLELSVARERYQHPVRIWHPRSEWQGLKMDVRLAEARALLKTPVKTPVVREKNEDGEYIVDTSARYAEEDAAVASGSYGEPRSSWESTSWEDRREMALQRLRDEVA